MNKSGQVFDVLFNVFSGQEYGLNPRRFCLCLNLIRRHLGLRSNYRNKEQALRKQACLGKKCVSQEFQRCKQ